MQVLLTSGILLLSGMGHLLPPVTSVLSSCGQVVQNHWLFEKCPEGHHWEVELSDGSPPTQQQCSSCFLPFHVGDTRECTDALMAHLLNRLEESTEPLGQLCCFEAKCIPPSPPSTDGTTTTVSFFMSTSTSSGMAMEYSADHQKDPDYNYATVIFKLKK